MTVGKEKSIRMDAGDARRQRRDSSNLNRRIDAFHADFHEPLTKLCAHSPVLGDLALSFPALLFALATGYGLARRRAAVKRMVIAGKPLKSCAETLDLPWWTRKLPPGALTSPLGILPTGRGADKIMMQLVPASPEVANSWLGRVTYAAEANGESFALWAARHNKAHAPQPDSETFMLLTAWAWFADHPETQGHRLLRKAWSPATGLRRAIDEMMHWRRRIALMSRLGNGITDSWIAEGSALGFDFVALRNVEDFVAESVAMDNCLDQYAEHLECDATRIFSVRKNGQPVADLEIGMHEEEPRMPALKQLRGRRNRRASGELWRAAYAWLGASALKPLPGDRNRLQSPARHRKARRLFWQPYLDSLKGSGHEERFRLLALGGARRNRTRTAGTGLDQLTEEALLAACRERITAR